jgi:hypothetical protein
MPRPVIPVRPEDVPRPATPGVFTGRCGTDEGLCRRRAHSLAWGSDNLFVDLPRFE